MGTNSHNKKGWGGGGSLGGGKIRSGGPGSGPARGEGMGLGGWGGIGGGWVAQGVRARKAELSEGPWSWPADVGWHRWGGLFKNTSPAICRLASKKDDLKLPWQSYAQKAPPW